MAQSVERSSPQDVTDRLFRTRFSDARALFCAGSVVRGEGTAHSDLDIVVVYDRVPNAWRESLVWEGWPVELFVHDPETLAYYVAEDVAGGRPCLAQMLASFQLSAFSFQLSAFSFQLSASSQQHRTASELRSSDSRPRLPADG
jgi:hypothetical protein